MVEINEGEIMGLKIGVCGVGRFAPSFVQLFHFHPLVDEVVLADLVAERTREQVDKYGIKRVVGSLDELCASDVDAVSIFTQRQLHAPMAVQAMEAGKHVYSAVPIGISLDEVEAVVSTAARTGQIYMMGETSYYYPCTLFCRDHFQKGEMGRFVYAEAQYLHDMEHFYASFQHSGGKDWKRLAGLPPMYYCSHSVSMALSVTGAHATHVSCMGFEDHHEDEVFGAGRNDWDNPFSNQTALLRTSDGGVARINEMRRIGWAGEDSVYMSFFGTKASYEQHGVGSSWITGKKEEPAVDVTEQVTCVGGEHPLCGYSPVHPRERLPESFSDLPNGHSGSHQFLADDFVKACVENRDPPCHAWASARWMIPGLIAHESAMQGGELLEVPDLGDPPR
jgi:predicted dehydrogenase